MKKYSLLFCVLLSMGLQAQIQQNIVKLSGNVASNGISEIDSIRFNAGGDEMQVVLQGGETISHLLGEIDSVAFGETPNPLAHSCGADSVHNPNLTYGSITDQEGNVYKTITIGSQEWMAENLKTSIYLNGDAIPVVTDNGQWSDLVSGARCYYNNDNQNDCPYGMLYNWYAVSDVRNVCPTGWHVPTDEDWSLIINYLDPNALGGNNSNNAGDKMKNVGFQYWLLLNQNASNSSGFSGLPYGYRSGDNGSSLYLGNYGYWWSSSEINLSASWYRLLYFNSGSCTRDYTNKKDGYSVRCLKN